MPQVKPVAKIHAAATYFVFVSRDPRQIADAFNLKNVRTVHRWAETPEWTEILDICGYTGDRNFQHQPTRKIEQDLFSKARAVYVALIAEGVPKHKRNHHRRENRTQCWTYQKLGKEVRVGSGGHRLTLLRLLVALWVHEGDYL